MNITNRNDVEYKTDVNVFCALDHKLLDESESLVIVIVIVSAAAGGVVLLLGVLVARWYRKRKGRCSIHSVSCILATKFTPNATQIFGVTRHEQRKT